MATLTKTKSNGNGRLFPKLVNDFFDTDFFTTPGIFGLDSEFSRLSASVPSANITETNKEFNIELAAPGLEKKDFKIEVENGSLTISAGKKSEEKEENENYRRREFSYQSFCRSFTLPENSVPDKIDAHYENGILKLTLPKKEITLSKPKKEIKVS